MGNSKPPRAAREERPDWRKSLWLASRLLKLSYSRKHCRDAAIIGYGLPVATAQTSKLFLRGRPRLWQTLVSFEISFAQNPLRRILSIVTIMYSRCPAPTLTRMVGGETGGRKLTL